MYVLELSYSRFPELQSLIYHASIMSVVTTIYICTLTYYYILVQVHAVISKWANAKQLRKTLGLIIISHGYRYLEI